MDTNASSINVKDFCPQKSRKWYWTKCTDPFTHKTEHHVQSRNTTPSKKGMAYVSLTFFVLCIGIMAPLKVSCHVHESRLSSTKTSTDSPDRKDYELMKNSMDDPNLITSSRYASSLELFFDKMEILSAHIDRLHERYMRFNDLDDDYISREFSVESPLNEDNAD